MLALDENVSSSECLRARMHFCLWTTRQRDLVRHLLPQALQGDHIPHLLSPACRLGLDRSLPGARRDHQLRKRRPLMDREPQLVLVLVYRVHLLRRVSHFRAHTGRVHHRSLLVRQVSGQVCVEKEEHFSVCRLRRHHCLQLGRVHEHIGRD